MAVLRHGFVFCRQKLTETLDQHVINGDRQRLLRQLTVVTKRVFAKILEKQSQCTQEMARVKEIEEQLQEGLLVCRQGRQGLTQARKEFTASSLGILAAYRRRQQAQKLLDDLNIIRTLVRKGAAFDLSLSHTLTKYYLSCKIQLQGAHIL